MTHRTTVVNSTTCNVHIQGILCYQFKDPNFYSLIVVPLPMGCVGQIKGISLCGDYERLAVGNKDVPRRVEVVSDKILMSILVTERFYIGRSPLQISLVQ